MGRINLLSGKGILVALFAVMCFVLLLPLVIFVAQRHQTFQSDEAVPVESPSTLSFTNGQGIIAGYVYHDNNQDGERESEEKPFSGTLIQMKTIQEKHEDGKIVETHTDSSGYFKFRFSFNSADHSTFMIKVILPKNYKTVDTNPIMVSNLKPKVEKIVEFGLIPYGDALITPTPTKKLVKKVTKPTPTEDTTPTP